MATWWIDPYLQSSHGGIHGTTSNGAGTYASPWKISDLYDNNSNNKYSSLANGDEIRIKGQTLASYNFVATNWSGVYTSTSSGVTYVQRYQHASITGQYCYAIRKDTGEKVWKAQGYSSYQQFDTPAGVSTWREAFPLLEGSTSTTGLYVMPTEWNIQRSQLYAANGNSTNMYFLNGDHANLSQLTQYHAIKITAGWVSETSQLNGYTIICVDYSTSYSGNVNWGCSEYTYYGMGYIWWDCLDTLNLASMNRYANHRLAGGKVHLDVFKGNSYHSGYYNEMSASEVVINQIGGGGYNKFWMKENPNDNASDNVWDTNLYQHMCDVRMWTGGYQNEVQCYYPSESQLTSLTNTSPREITFKIKYYDGYYGYNIYDQDSGAPGTFTIQFPDGWHHTKKESGFSLTYFGTKNAAGNVTETIGTVSSYAPSFPTTISVEENLGYGGLGTNPYNNETWFQHHNDSTAMLSSATSIFGSAEVSQGWRAWSSLLNLTNSETLETATGNPLSFTGSAGEGLPWKVTVFKNSEDYRPLTMVGPDNSNSGAAIMHFNSPANGNKLCWHFFNNNNGKTYGDVYALQIPDFSSNDLRLNGDFTFTASMSLTWSIQLYYIEADANDPAFMTGQSFGPYTSPTETSTTAVFAETITSATLVAANPKTLWAHIKISKGNNTKGNVIFNQLDLTQI